MEAEEEEEEYCDEFIQIKYPASLGATSCSLVAIKI